MTIYIHLWLRCPTSALVWRRGFVPLVEMKDFASLTRVSSSSVRLFMFSLLLALFVPVGVLRSSGISCGFGCCSLWFVMVASLISFYFLLFTRPC